MVNFESIRKGHLIIQNLNAPLSYIKPNDPFALPSKSDNVEPIVPCKNLRDDFLRCIEEVINSKKAIESIDLYDRKIEFYEKADFKLKNLITRLSLKLTDAPMK